MTLQARLVPDRLSTLVLASCKSGYRWNFPTIRTAWLMARFLFGTVWTAEQGLRLTISIMFPPMFMNLRDTVDGQTRRQILQQVISSLVSLPNRPQTSAFLSQEFTRRIDLSAKAPTRGRLGQMAAVLNHRMKAEELADLARLIPKIAIIQVSWS